MKKTFEEAPQKIFELAGKYSCLCLCYLFCIGIDAIEFIKKYDKLVKEGIITEDCFVLDGIKLLKFFGAKDPIIIREGNNDGSLVIEKWTYNGMSHFVVADENGLVYDSLGESNCYKYGTKVETRTVYTKENTWT